MTVNGAVMNDNTIQEAISRLSNRDLDGLETRIRKARAVNVSKNRALDALLKEIRRDRMWREKGNQVS